VEDLTPENGLEGEYQKIPPDAKDEIYELQLLLDENKLGFLAIPAATALQNNDVNTIRGILKRHKAMPPKQEA
jgi:hypothetical protein